MSTITFLTNYFYPHIGGVEKHVWELSNRLLENGHKVKVITSRYDYALDEVSQEKGIEIVRIDTGVDQKSKASIWKSIISNYQRLNDSDIVHVHDVGFWLFPVISQWRKFYITFHGYEGSWPISNKAIAIRRLSNLLASGSINVGDFIEKHYGTKPDYVIYGASNQLLRKQKSRKHEMPNILFLGRLDKDMGIYEFIDACKHLRNKYQFNVTFVGGGQKEILTEASKVGTVTGFVTNVSDYLIGSDLIFTGGYLGLLESFMAKKPTLSFYNTPIKKDYLELSPFKKWTMIANSTDQIKNDLENYLIDKGYIQKHTKSIEEAYKWSEKQTWDKILDIYISLWRKKHPWLSP